MTLKRISGTTLLVLLSGTSALAQTPPQVAHDTGMSEIVVTGVYHKLLPKLLEPIVNTPQQVVTVTSGLLGEFQVADVQRALQMSSLVSSHGNDAAPGNDVEIHGFTTQYDMYMDGLPEYGKF